MAVSPPEPMAPPPAGDDSLRRAPRPGMRRLLVGAVVVAVLVGVAFGATRPLGNAAPGPTFYSLASEVPGLGIGNRAPGLAADGSDALRLVSVDGQPIDLRAYAGHPIWLIFWKTACPPCEQEAPDVRAAYQAHITDGLVVLGVNVWDTAEMVREYEQSHDLAYPIGIDTTGAVRDAYGVWGAPIHYFIDRSGAIRDRYFGPLDAGTISGFLNTII